MGEYKDCLSCTASMSEPAERDGEYDRKILEGREHDERLDFILQFVHILIFIMLHGYDDGGRFLGYAVLVGDGHLCLTIGL